MIKIMADTSILMSSYEAKEKGITIAPLSVTVNGNTYKEMDEISSMDFVKIVREGHIPTSSQPAIGDILANFDAVDENDEIINNIHAVEIARKQIKEGVSTAYAMKNLLLKIGG